MPEPKSSTEIRASLVKYAAFCLSRQPYFYARLQAKLVQRALKLGFKDFTKVISGILADLQKSGYLNDSYLAASYVRGQLAKSYGPRLIRLKLRQLGLAEPTILDALKEAADDQQIPIIRKFAQKYAKLDPRKTQSKLYARGFSPSAINKVFDVLGFAD